MRVKRVFCPWVKKKGGQRGKGSKGGGGGWDREEQGKGEASL